MSSPSARKLAEVLEQKQLLVLAEPGGGKSIVARAAVREFTKRTATLPVFVELKEYRGNLAELISSATPAWALQTDAAVDGQILQRAFVLDGLDEVPVDFQQAFFLELSSLLAGDSKNIFFLTSRLAFYVSHPKALPPVSGLFHLCDFSDEDIQKYVELQVSLYRQENQHLTGIWHIAGEYHFLFANREYRI